ncbi:CPBP family intramembrane metalloprotease [Agreia sp. PsM10]|uniref:CPBP family intramembrane glutamic endopeptidase n=1 Tax=Agreia sp. PsM10 TaxID=3030533 RepID=UPI00263B9221|nr:CPBP family intramembrane glutamic endopeptidase [Agreia sp. PsM10]MDN4641345.1 CPBP family intramembrane metalloprotease [Agreia sp. PsM10]
MAGLTNWLQTPRFYDGHLVLILSYAVVWVPFLGAVGVACFLRGTRSLAHDVGLRITFFDVLLGVGAGFLVRAIAGIIEIAFIGRMSGLGVTFGDTVYDGWWVFGTILAPVLLAPFVEELFFRGLLQRALLQAGSHRLSARSATVLSIITSAALFALLHLTQAANPIGAAVLGISAVTFGLAAALIAGLTGRIGGAIIAHVVFNGSLVAASLFS